MARGDTYINALIGAVVTIVAWVVIPVVGGVLGGGVAGYLQQTTRKDGARVGAISGAIASVPAFVLLFAGVTMFFGFGGVGVPGGAEILVILLIFLILGGLTVGASALGGYLGAYLALDTGAGRERATTP